MNASVDKLLRNLNNSIVLKQKYIFYFYFLLCSFSELLKASIIYLSCLTRICIPCSNTLIRNSLNRIFEYRILQNVLTYTYIDICMNIMKHLIFPSKVVSLIRFVDFFIFYMFQCQSNFCAFQLWYFFYLAWIKSFLHFLKCRPSIIWMSVVLMFYCKVSDLLMQKM